MWLEESGIIQFWVMDITVTKLKKNGCEKNKPFKKAHRCAQLHKMKSNHETWPSLLKAILHIGRDWKDHADIFHEDRWPKTACSHECTWEQIKEVTKHMLERKLWG